MKITTGLKLLDEIEGSGKPANDGDHVVYNLKIFLNDGDEVLFDDAISRNLSGSMTWEESGRVFIDHAATLGKRRLIPGVEDSLIGMKAGGYRKVKISPHLAYREQGIPGLIPENAVLVVELWLHSIV